MDRERRESPRRPPWRRPLGSSGAGDLFGFYPEGTRSPDGRLYRGRSGLGWLALNTGAPVIPVAMIGTRKMLPPGAPLPRPTRIEIKIGKPMEFGSPGGRPAGQGAPHDRRRGDARDRRPLRPGVRPRVRVRRQGQALRGRRRARRGTTGPFRITALDLPRPRGRWAAGRTPTGSTRTSGRCWPSATREAPSRPVPRPGRSPAPTAAAGRQRQQPAAGCPAGWRVPTAVARSRPASRAARGSGCRASREAAAGRDAGRRCPGGGACPTGLRVAAGRRQARPGALPGAAWRGCRPARRRAAGGPAAAARRRRLLCSTSAAARAAISTPSTITASRSSEPARIPAPDRAALDVAPSRRGACVTEGWGEGVAVAGGAGRAARVAATVSAAAASRAPWPPPRCRAAGDPPRSMACVTAAAVRPGYRERISAATPGGQRRGHVGARQRAVPVAAGGGQP